MAPTPSENEPPRKEPKRYATPRGNTTLANLVRMEGRMLDKPYPIPKKRPKRKRK
jgi:hypothetical protein